MYVVRKGDTLSGIAKRFAVTLRNILAANPQITDPSLIHVGDAIRIPAAYLPTLGGSGTSPVDINNLGQIVGSSGTPSGTAHAVLIDGGRITDLGTLGGDWSRALAVNDLGQVVGWNDTASEERAFLWQDGVMTDLGILEPRDINNRGQIVTRQDYILQDGVKTRVGTLGGKETAAMAINDLGQVVGYSTTKSGDQHAFIWQDGVMRDLGTLGGRSSSALAINDLGQVVGSSWINDRDQVFEDYTIRSGDSHAFIWQDGVMTDLGTLGGSDSWAYDINDRGQVVGHSEAKSELSHAFIWQDGTMTDLGTLTATGTSYAHAVNDLGQVLGDWDGYRAFLWQDGVWTDLGPPAPHQGCG